MDDKAKIMKYLISVERLGQEILSERRKVISLDKKRNENREALRNLSKSSQSKCWISVGSVFIKYDNSSAISLLEADQKQLNIEISKIISDLKVKINELRDLEMQPPKSGLMLVPLSRTESAALTKAGLLFSLDKT